jgi:hypothetical protein
MMNRNLIQLWNEITEILKLTKDDMKKIYPNINDHNYQYFDEFIDHNELELACDELWDLIENHGIKEDKIVNRIQIAFEKMELDEKAKKVGRFIGK